MVTTLAIAGSLAGWLIVVRVFTGGPRLGPAAAGRPARGGGPGGGPPRSRPDHGDVAGPGGPWLVQADPGPARAPGAYPGHVRAAGRSPRRRRDALRAASDHSPVSPRRPAAGDTRGGTGRRLRSRRGLVPAGIPRRGCRRCPAPRPDPPHAQPGPQGPAVPVRARPRRRGSVRRLLLPARRPAPRVVRLLLRDPVHRCREG